MDPFLKLIESLLQGILLGGLYATIGLGLSLIFGVGKIINIAHGEFVLLSAYLAFTLLTKFQIDPLLGLILFSPFFFALGFLTDKFIVGRSLKKSEAVTALTTIGLSVTLENLYLLVWTPQLRGLLTNYTLITYKVWEFNVPLIYLMNFFIALTIMLLLREFLRKTYIGIAIRALSENWEMAQLMGINTERVRSFAFGIGTLIASISGVLIGLIYPFSPSTGKICYLAISFGVVILGGLGSLLGTFVGGILIGLVQTLAATFIDPAWQLLISYLLIFVVLAIRPGGLLGE